MTASNLSQMKGDCLHSVPGAGPWRLTNTSGPRLLCTAVSRLECKGDLYEMDLILDVNNEIYPLEVNSPFSSRTVVLYRQASCWLREALSLIMSLCSRQLIPQGAGSIRCSERSELHNRAKICRDKLCLAVKTRISAHIGRLC